jgi:chemotaxis protein CheC
MDIKNLTPVQVDALKEVANIGGCHAATALSQLVHQKVMVHVPEVLIGPLEEVIYKVASPETVVTSILMYFLGDLTGRSLLIYPKEDSDALVELLMPQSSDRDRKELTESLLKEVSNILSCSYMNTLGEFLDVLILPSVPGMVVDMVGAVLSSVVLEFGSEKDTIICLETQFAFSDDSRTMQAYFLLLPDLASLKIIFKKLNLL